MMGFDSPDHHHHHHLSQELVVNCGYTRVIASRVGALGTSFVRAAKPRDFTRAKREKTPRDANSYIPRFPPGKLREFTLKELGKATANFSRERLIGRGGFGKVYRGILSGGAVVAVKVMGGRHSIHFRDQFQLEMNASCTVMSLAHPNLVPAIGYHSSRKRKMVKVMIVYPFMANGDVGHYLGDHRPSSLTPLDWPTRKRIALQVARGICSLHQLGIIHQDIKPSNVLLDENFNARVGDFGLAKSMGLPHNNDYLAGLHADVDSNHYVVFTQICGTVGYISPEMLLNGHCSRKSDVYAFGVTLIQIVTKKNIWAAEGSRQFLIDRAERLFENNEDLTRLMHPGMSGMNEENEAIELIRLGLVCAQKDPQKRPLMPEVIAMMEGSSATLKQRWDNYEYRCSARQMSSYNQSETDSDIPSHWIRFSSVRTSSSRDNDEEEEEELCSAIEFDINEEEPRDDGHHSRRAYDFTQEEWKIEHLAGLTCSTNSRSLENDAWAVFVEVDQNERGNAKQSSSQSHRHEITTKLREVLDRMHEMESDHQTVMVEMQQEQMAKIRSMIKMQEQYIQKVNEMQSEMDQLKVASQKAFADESNHWSIPFPAVQLKSVLFCFDISFRIFFVFYIVSIFVRGLCYVNNLQIKM